ncbi:MAG: aldehyde dehydrogenase family protein, partial [Planctomycetota bacterium]
IAKVMCDLFDLTEGVLSFLPGQGETVGAHLVRHPQIDMIAFTGSAAVGQDILKAAATHPPTGKLAKHVVCETGGKNSIIVDASADLDEAVVGVRDSAFGFQGQKCSACSRVIVVDSAHDLFVERLVEATKSLHMADPADPACDVGPVIDDEAAEKIRSYVEIGKQEATLAYEMPVPDGLAEKVGKPFVGPTIFTDVKPDARIANEEIFGPVLAVITIDSFDEALRLANAPHYKLTGGVYSRMPSHLEQARDEFVVGNLYLNRGCTGALVGRQPFGGFGMSGLGSKAGGVDYLKQFVVPRAVTENTMRRGFAPQMEGAGQVGGDNAAIRAGG